MDLSTLQTNWDLLASSDPLWAILTHPAKKGNRWDVDEFFQSGVWEVTAVLERMEALHPLTARRRALDFGCGVGRLTQALADHFEEIWGVDIAPTMIELARKYNRHGERCRFHLNCGSDLSHFPDGHFDFLYSNITLQHMEPRFSKHYMQEFVRVLSPNGIAVFQLPSRQMNHWVSQWVAQRLLGAWLSRRVRQGRPVIAMYGVAKASVVKLLEDAGGKIVDIQPDQSAGPDWESYRYFVKRI